MATLSDVELFEAMACVQSRADFWAFRQHLNRDFVKGWWQKSASIELQRFYDDLIAGRRPKLVIEAPPQHGKSRMVIEFIAWLCGKNPDLKVIYTSFSERLGERANLQLQKIFNSYVFKKVFADCRINEVGVKNGDENATRNRSLIEFLGRDGYFRNTTVRGAITGETLDLGVIDDPIKSREEAGSQAVRDKTWYWFTDDFFTRFSKNAGFLAILTRWHLDDPIGRLKAQNADIKVLTYKAIAETDEPPFRVAGEPLFPELKPLDFLLERKGTMANANWEALYQQNPQIEGGEIIHVKDFQYYENVPPLKYRCIFGDTAQKTGQQNDYSVFECWGLGLDGRAYLIDLARGKWEAPELERRAVAFWQKHKSQNMLGGNNNSLRFFGIEDKVSGTGLIQSIRRNYAIPLRAIQRNKDKYTRLLDVLGYIEGGLVVLPKDAEWLNDFLTECENFSADDRHLHDDQIDPMVDAINEFLGRNLIKMWERII